MALGLRPGVHMSEAWQFYFTTVEDRPASIFFDDGISERLDHDAGKNLLVVDVAVKFPRDDGMTRTEEFGALVALEEDLVAIVEERLALYVGRITTGGHRRFHIFTDEASVDWRFRIEGLAERHGYEIAAALEADPERDGYWTDLYPSADDRRVIEDMSVLGALSQHGDDGSSVRPVEHWSYFDAQNDADRFAAWLVGAGYEVISNGPLEPEDEGEVDDRVCVQFTHETAVTLRDITSHTIALQRQAKGHRGEYDGWECVVVRAGDPT